MRRRPNGYGTITKLSGNRSKPWIVKVTIHDAEGHGRQVPIGYTETEEQANILLAQYNDNPWNIDRNKVTLAELYKRWYEIKFPKLGKALQGSLKTAYKYCSKYYGTKYRSIRSYQMQDTIDNCGRGYSTQGAIKTLWGHLDRFAFELDIIDKMYSEITTTEPIPETTREPFTADQIAALWDIVDQPWVDTVLIYIYTGFRLMELLDMKIDHINLEEGLFCGGEKTSSGKNRIVPIHSKIVKLVQCRVEQSQSGYLFEYQKKKVNPATYHRRWDMVMKQIGADHTPHEARHTFETLLDNADGNRKCIDMLMGHKSKDVGNRVYNHKTVDQLRETIELIK